MIIDKSTQDLWSEAHRASPRGYDVVFDANGYTTMRESYRHLAPMGKLIVYGSHSLLPRSGGRIHYLRAGLGLLKIPRFAPLELMTLNRGIIGFNVSFLFDEHEMIRDCADGLQKWLAQGMIRPIPITEIPFEDVAEAHRLIESGKSVGKIVLTT